MKRFGKLALIAVLVLSLSVIITACGGGGGGGGASPSTTPPPPAIGAVQSLSTTTQGAQAGSAGLNVAQSVSSTGGMLSGLVGSQSPKFKIPFASTSVPNKAVAGLTAKVKPLSAKAKAIRSSIMSAVSTTTMACDNVGGTQTMTLDDSTAAITLLMNNCQSGFDLNNGTIIITSGNMTIGTAASPFVNKTCTSVDCSAFNTIMTSVLSLSFTESPDLFSTTFLMTINGSIETVDNTVTPSTTDTTSMTGLSMKDVISQTTASLISGLTDTFNVDDLTINGSTAFTHTETGNDYGESDSFQDFKVTTMTDASYTTAYLSIDGIFAIALSPSDKCIEGTFAFSTTTPLQMDLATGSTLAGEIMVNYDTNVMFSSNGLTVTLAGGTPTIYTEAELNGLCAL